MDDLASLAPESFCYLSTNGRRTGKRHEIEIWFGCHAGHTIYLMAGGGHRADWVRNLKAEPRVTVRIADQTFAGTARVVDDQNEAAAARRLLATKYQGWQEGTEMSSWAQTALPIAIELNGPT